MLSFAAELSSVASVSPPSSFEDVFGLVAVWCGSPGKAEEAEGAAGNLREASPLP